MRESLPIDPDTEPRVADLTRRLRRLVPDPWDIVIVVALGGATGSMCRWAVAELMPHEADEVAWSTFVVNVVGALALGVLMVCIVDIWQPHRYVRPFVGVGVLGGFTTFSTYMLDARSLTSAGEFGLAAGYVFGSLFVGLVSVAVGIAGTRLVLRPVVRERVGTMEEAR